MPRAFSTLEASSSLFAVKNVEAPGACADPPPIPDWNGFALGILWAQYVMIWTVVPPAHYSVRRLRIGICLIFGFIIKCNNPRRDLAYLSFHPCHCLKPFRKTSSGWLPAAVSGYRLLAIFTYDCGNRARYAKNSTSIGSNNHGKEVGYIPILFLSILALPSAHFQYCFTEMSSCISCRAGPALMAK